MTAEARFYLLTPRLGAWDDFAPLLSQALSTRAVACVLARVAEMDETSAKRVLQPLAKLAQGACAAFLVEGDSRLAAYIGADGVHLPAPGEALDEALRKWKPDGIVGTGGLRTRDDAMNAGEGGVDYILFGEPKADGFVPPAEGTAERVEWWAQIFNLPCVAFAGHAGDVAILAAAGADFIAPGDWLWSDPAQVASAMKLACAAVAAHPLPTA